MYKSVICFKSQCKVSYTELCCLTLYKIRSTDLSLLWCCWFGDTEEHPACKKYHSNNWRVPWKNRISSTTMKLRKSLEKPVTQQNISNCLVLPPEIVMHNAFNVILWMSTDICIVMHLGWKNRTTPYNCRFSATSLALRVIFDRRN